MKSFITENKNLSFVTFYGSQLGQAKSIAESFIDTATEHELTTQVFELNDIKNVEDLNKITCPIVIIASTTGDGEPPENADKFWRKIRRKILKPHTLQSVRFTLLGLGDTNFNNFCNCGKQLNKRFEELGAQSIYPPAWADDAIGQDTVIEDWIDGLWPALKELIGCIDDNNMSDEAKLLEPNTDGATIKLTLPACPATSLILNYVESDYPPEIDLLNPPMPYPLIDDTPKLGKITAARCLTKETSVKTTIEVTIDFLKETFEFEPGDAIGIVCSNPKDEVNLLLRRLNALHLADKTLNIELISGAKGKYPSHIPKITTLRQCFLQYCDIRTAPKKTFIRLLAESTADENDKKSLLELCSRQGSAKFEETVRGGELSLLDLLSQFPSCLPSPAALIEHLPRLIPRAYSISSSPLATKNSFTVTFNVITFSKENGRSYQRLGICSGFLLKCAKKHADISIQTFNSDQSDIFLESFENLRLENDISSTIIVYKRKNHFFRLPSDVTAPVVMVGPGTGVAPFIGFLQHRSKQLSDESIQLGKMVLYFGNRHKQLDFLYEDFLTSSVSNGILTSLNVTFSRDDNQNGTKYVQDSMESSKGELVSCIMDEGGYIYVCGDAKNMAKNVREKLISCIEDVKGLTKLEATEHITKLIASKRYLQDVWC